MNPDTYSMIALILILSALVLVILIITHRGKPRLNKNYFTKHWDEIEKLEGSTLAVLKADSLLDEALKHANIKGGTMGERLNNSVGFIKDINSVWSAHKLRNVIAHEHDASPSSTDCHRALKQFKRALKDLGAL